MKVRLNFADGSCKIKEITSFIQGEKEVYEMGEVDGDVKTVDFCCDAAEASEGDEGYYLIPHCGYYGESFLMSFSGHEGQSFTGGRPMMSFYGGRSASRSFYATVTGMEYEYDLIAECNDGKYNIYPRFHLEDTDLYEPIRVEFKWFDRPLDYSEICCEYRSELLKAGRCKPISERCKTDEKLAYAADSLMIRMRIAWKLTDPEVHYQTHETEPPLYVSMTFDEVADFMRECKRQGIEKAEFCLVGWNVKGHDGRWPETFPVEPELGGEEGLKRLIKTADELGYRVGGHTNFSDAYTIADTWDQEKIRVKRNGKIDAVRYYCGGMMHYVCPLCILDDAEERMKKIGELGFTGLHYIDVIGVVPPTDCTHPDHKITRKQGAECYTKLARLSHEHVGGFTTEGGYDFISGENDSALYLSAREPLSDDRLPEVCDEIVPLWQLVYHGITLSTPYIRMLKNGLVEDDRLIFKNIEYGGRSIVYKVGRMNEEQTRDYISRIKKLYDEYKLRSHTEKAFMIKHEKIGDNIFRTTYSDGTVITVDHDKMTHSVE